MVSVEILPFLRSDHAYVFLRLRLPTAIERGSGYWKFNAALLKDPVFCQTIIEFWRQWQVERSTFFSIAASWDASKARLREVIRRRFAKEKALNARRRLRSLERCLFHLHRRQQLGEDVSGELDDTRAEIEAIHLARAAAANDCNFQSSAALTDDPVERLQQSFTKPWQITIPNEIPKLGEIVHLLKDTKPPLPSIGQIKAILKHLNPRKASGSDDIPAWLLRRYSEELAPVIHNIICML